MPSRLTLSLIAFFLLAARVPVAVHAQVPVRRPPAARIQPLAPGTVIVTPKGGGPFYVSPNGSGMAGFYVHSTRTVPTTYAISCTPSGHVSACTTDLSSITLNFDETIDVVASYSVDGSAGTGLITVLADGGARDTGWDSVTVVPVSAPTVARPRQPDSVFSRAHCLTGTAGIGAWSCGDLVVAVETPSFTTLDRARSLTLAHVSAAAAPRPLVAVDVTVPSGQPSLDHVTARLTVHDTVRTTATYSPWINATKQLVVGWDASGAPTGAYPYTLNVTVAATGDSNSTSVSGLLLVVNRSGSVYGAGWEWLGVERLVLNQPVGSGQSHLLWVGGDGSAKLYRQVNSTHWVAPPEEYQDTIVLASGEYTRTLRHGVQVVFDNTGRHLRTSNRATQVTNFYWGSAARIDSIRVPPAGSGSRTFRMHYNGSGLLDSVMLGGRDLGVSVQTVGVPLLTQWRWPDGTFQSFSYDASHRLYSSTDTRGGSTAITYGSQGLVERGVVYYASDSSVTRFVPWQAAGYAEGAWTITPGDTALAVTTIFGPRVGVSDDAVFHVDRWGAPIETKDPLGVKTRYTRGNRAVPSLVTQIDFPNTRRALMTYNSRGNLTALTDSSWGTWAFPALRTAWAYGDANDLDSPSQVTAPDGTVSQYHYNTLGLTDSILDARGHVTRFSFETSIDSMRGQIRTVRDNAVNIWFQSAGVDSVRNLTDSLFYNASGNTILAIDRAGGFTRYGRDAHGRVTSVVNPLGFRQAFVYDSMDRTVQTTDYFAVDSTRSYCRTHEFTCDTALVRTSLNPSGSSATTTATYTQGLLTQILDPRSVPHTFRYDLRGLLVADIDEAGAVDSARFDNAGLLIAHVTRTHDTLTYSYDVGNRLTKWRIPAKTDTLFTTVVTAPLDSVTSVFDSLGNLLRQVNRHGAIKRSYFENGAVRFQVDSGPTSLTTSGMVTDSVKYGYDSGGRLNNLVQFNWIGGDTVRYTYKSSGDLDSLNIAWRDRTGVHHETTRFAWDSLGRRRQLRYPFNSMTVTSHYDALGTLRSIESTNPGSFSTQNRFNVTMAQDSVDLLGRPLHQTVTCGHAFTASDSAVPCGGWSANATDFRYNRVGQLVVQSQLNFSAFLADTFRYDLSGNRLSRQEIVGGAGIGHRFLYPSSSNRVTSQVDSIYYSHATATQHYGYTAAGARRADSTGTLLIRRFQYDAAGRLVGSADIENLPGPTQVITPNSCRYDADGRNIQVCGAGVVSLLGDNVSRENEQWWYVHAPGIDEPILMVRRQRIDSFTLARLQGVSDGLGHLLSVADKDGDINSAYASPGDGQSVWGSAGFTSRGQTFGPNRWASPTLGAIATFRNRQYDPATGRWLQEDPIGLAGGVNLYQYTGNNPASFGDPFGLTADTLESVSVSQTSHEIPTRAIRQLCVDKSRASEVQAIYDESVAAGVPVSFNNAYRDRITPGTGNNPSAGGKSPHLAGFAFDINPRTMTLNQLTSFTSIAKKHGFSDIRGDPGHYQAKGGPEAIYKTRDAAIKEAARSYAANECVDALVENIRGNH